MKIQLFVTVIKDRFLILLVGLAILGSIFLYSHFLLAEGNLANHIVISEVRISGGSGKSTDEFVELYNPTESDIDISGWKITKLTKSASVDDQDDIVSSTLSGTIVKARGHLLIAHFDYTIVDNINPDVIYQENSFSNNNSVVLLNQFGVIVDMVGWEGAKNFEGASPAPTSTVSKPSIERKPSGAEGNGYDSDNNGDDFVIALSTPQNSASVAVPASNQVPNALFTVNTLTTSTNSEIMFDAGDSGDADGNVVLYSWEFGDGGNGTGVEVSHTYTSSSVYYTVLTVTDNEGAVNTTSTLINIAEPVDLSTILLNENIFINEFLPNQATGTEWIELYNFGSSTAKLVGWSISDGVGVIAELTSDIDAHGYLVVDIDGSHLNNTGGDAIVLKNKTGEEINRVQYGDFGVTSDTNAPLPEKGNSVARKNFQDTNNYKNDFAETTVTTKGLENIITAPVVPVQQNSGGGSGGGSSNNYNNLQNVSNFIFINELASDPTKGMNEFVELYNNGDSAISLTNWWIEDGGGTRTDLNGNIQAKNYFVLEKPHGSLNNDGDMVSLYDPSRNLVDRVVYGSWNDGNLKDNAPIVSDPYSLVRKVDGADHNNDAYDFAVTSIITKGAGNIVQTPAITVATSTPLSILEMIKKVTPLSFQNGELILDVDVERDVFVGDIVLFDATNSVDPIGRQLKIQWRFGDGHGVEGAKVEHIYQEKGNYYVIVTGIDQDNKKTEENFYINVHESLEKNFDEELSEDSGGLVSIASVTKAKSVGKSAKITKTGINNKGEVDMALIDGLNSGDKIIARGIVSVLPGVFGSQYFYITNETNQNGVQIYMYKKDFPLLKIGDSVVVNGSISRAYNEVRIKITDKNDIKILGKKEEPQAQLASIENISTEMHGSVVQVQGEITELKGTYMYLDDGSEEVKVYFKKGAEINKKELKEGDTTKVVGIVGLTKSGLQLLPRSQQDIQIISVSKLVEEDKNKTTGVAENYFAATAGGITTVVLSFFAKARKGLIKQVLGKIGGLAMLIIKKRKG